MLNSRDRSFDYQSFFDNVVPKCFITERAFYSQVFKPELITELFEGWELNIIDGIEQIRRIQPFCAIEFYKKYVAYIIVDNCNCTDTTRTFLPRTLDDFISDCQRAGIELIRKEGGE
jgi:hypothetical protein